VHIVGIGKITEVKFIIIIFITYYLRIKFSKKKSDLETRAQFTFNPQIAVDTDCDSQTIR